MFLKTLSLAGFKSFADRTRLDFETGVNVVVGPNGSGKSNLLDALAWVMGTQATRSLRTEKMGDVIFAGTTTRPALGRAVVDLTFDNGDGFLPLDIPEITITRRLYRDGTSEYEINGAACRLLDIQELLSDGGVGRHQHVLVGQGQIGEILSARPDEHRAVIEEAAGVTKHRSRRDRALRRLEQTDVDVARLLDILEQQKRRMRPLQRQANAARRYHEVRAEARRLRLWLGGEELRHNRARMESVLAEQEERRDQIRVASEELAALEAGLEELRAAAGEAGRALERDTAAAARLETAAERLGRIGGIARERRSAAESRLAGAGERRRDLEDELRHLDEEIAAARRTESELAGVAEQRESALAELDDEERALAEQIRLPAGGVAAALRGDLRALENADQRDGREAEALARRVEVVTSRLADERDEAGRLAQSIRDADAGMAGLGATFTRARTEREAAENDHGSAREAREDARIARAAAEARVEAVRAALAGLGDPAAAERARTLDGVLGSLAARLDPAEDVARAVDAALGPWSEALAVAGDESLRGAAGHLKAEGLGGVRLVASPETSPPAPARAVAAQLGLDPLVDRLGPDADLALASLLLGDVLVVEGWSTGWAVVSDHPGLRAVTPEGDLVTAHGMILADPDGAGPAALEAAQVALEDAEVALARAESRHTTASRALSATAAAERDALERLEAAETALAGATEALRLVERTIGEGDAELQRLDQRLGAIAASRRARADRLVELRRQVSEFEGDEARHQEAWEALNRRRHEVAARRDEARRRREEVAAEHAAVVERRRLQEQRRAAARAALDGVDRPPVAPGSIEALAGIEAGARDAVRAVRDHVAALRRRQQALREQASAADHRLESAHRRRAELERVLSAAKDRAGTLAVEIAELDVRAEATAERLRRDADASEAEALAAPPPDGDGDPAERLATLDAQLRRMGPVNPLAAAEYEELEAEVATLESQLADLETSRRELRKVIAALDREMAELFRTAFAEIGALYAENFGLVFPGGRGRLVLTDPDRPLETGVEIEAQPLGKKVGRLSLLSGGERSLAALAFLFAVFRARPSPFYVLDEVEAALDAANLRRFLTLARTLQDSAQLVIITHQQQTMEAADVLYGVTMEPGESSVVVAKRLTGLRVP